MALVLRGYSVIATDQPLVCDLLQDNINRFLSRYEDAGNASDGLDAVAVKTLDWTEEYSRHAGPPDSQGTAEGELCVTDTLTRLGCTGPVDLIVLSDCLYSSAVLEPLLHVVDQVS